MDQIFSFSKSTPFRLGSESPDLVSIDFKDKLNCPQNNHLDVKQIDCGLKQRMSSNSCLSDTNLAEANLISPSDTIITNPLLTKGIGYWRRDFRPSSSEALDEIHQNKMKINLPPIRQQNQNTTQPSEDTHQSQIDLMLPCYESKQHNEFILNDMQNLLTNQTIERSTNSGAKKSQTYSVGNSHMYL